MKKTLLLITFLGGCFFMNAQTLQSENFGGLTLGNIGTDLTGTTAGQGSYFTFSSTGSNADFQVYNEGGDYGNALQINGSTTDTGTRFMWQDGLEAAWNSRTSGNNIIEVEYDLYTGPVTTSKNSMRVYLYDTTDKIVAGFRYTPETRVISGLAYYNNAGTINTYAFFLGAGGTNLTLTANTWVRLGFSFNQTTGEVRWKGPGFNGFVPGAATGLIPSEIDYVVVAGTANTVAAVGKFDNFIARASATDTLLGLDEISAPFANVISLYPNPANDLLNIRMSNASLTSIEIVDINGRTVNSMALNNVSDVQVNVSDLSAGIYMINIYSDNNKTTKKFVKN